MAFWDLGQNSLIVCTHGFIKKTTKTPKSEIKKAEALRTNYINRKS